MGKRRKLDPLPLHKSDVGTFVIGKFAHAQKTARAKAELNFAEDGTLDIYSSSEHTMRIDSGEEVPIHVRVFIQKRKQGQSAGKTDCYVHVYNPQTPNKKPKKLSRPLEIARFFGV